MKVLITKVVLYLSIAVALVIYLAIDQSSWFTYLGAVVPLAYAAITANIISKLQPLNQQAAQSKVWKRRHRRLSGEQVKAIETRFQLELPDQYVALLTENEFDYGLLYSVESLIEENESCRTAPVFSDYWDDSWFAVHADGGGNVYFITTKPHDGKIYDYDHEQTFPGYEPLARPAFDSFDELIDHLWDSEE